MERLSNIIKNYNREHKDSIISIPRTNMEIYKTYLYMKNNMTNLELKELEKVELPKPKTLKEFEIYRDCIDFYTKTKKIFEYKKGEGLYIDKDFERIFYRIVYDKDNDWGYKGEIADNYELWEYLEDKNGLLTREYETIPEYQNSNKKKQIESFDSFNYYMRKIVQYLYNPDSLSPSDIEEYDNLLYMCIEEYTALNTSKKTPQGYSRDKIDFFKGSKRELYIQVGEYNNFIDIFEIGRD